MLSLPLAPERAARLLLIAARMAKPRVLARSEETTLHKVADTHATKLSITLRYAFATARKAARRQDSAVKATSVAIVTLRQELKELLPKVLRKMYVAGGEVAAGGLKTLGDYEGHPFHGNQWTEGVSGNDPLAGEPKGEHTPAGQRKLISYLEKETGSKFKSHGSVGRGETSKNDFDVILVPETEEESARQQELANQYESELHDKVARGEITERQMMEELYGDAPDPMTKALTKIGFEAESSVEFDLSPSGVSGNPEIGVQRYHNKKTGHSIEIWFSLRGLRAASANLRTAKRDSKPKLDFTFNAKTQAAIDWADRHAAELIDQISETSREAINNAVAEFLETGDWKDYRDEILAAVGDEDRADLIARNESMVAVHEGQREAWGQAVEAGLLDNDSEREWIVVGDEKVCPICEGLEGTRAKLDEPYISDGEEYVGPPAHVSCRCSEGIV